MSFRPLFKASDIEKQLLQWAEAIERAAIERLKFLGEKFISYCRQTDTYQDQTGNLRSSVGYAILRNGVTVFESFPGAKDVGVKAGKVAVREALRELPAGNYLYLIGVAGMHYALILESKGKDVITGGALHTQAAATAMRDLQTKFNRGR